MDARAVRPHNEGQVSWPFASLVDPRAWADLDNGGIFQRAAGQCGIKPDIARFHVLDIQRGEEAQIPQRAGIAYFNRHQIRFYRRICRN